eukprot:m.102164 g.102164  ORF g.102164 m.102164 type:complete len:304 (-) comp15002_c1_seq1:133-1044(-)
MPLHSVASNLTTGLQASKAPMQSKGKGNSTKTTKSTKTKKETKPQPPSGSTGSARRHAPQNEKTFKTTILPHGGSVHFYAVPNVDGERAAAFFSDEAVHTPANSTQRVSYGGHEPSASMSISGTFPARYQCSQQPWAMATLGQLEKGIVPELYGEKLKKTTMTLGRRTRSAPAGLEGHMPPLPSFGTSDVEDPVAIITSGDAIASEVMLTYLKSVGPLERTVIATMLKDVASRIRTARSNAPRPGTAEARPASTGRFSTTVRRPPSSSSSNASSRHNSRPPSRQGTPAWSVPIEEEQSAPWKL